MNRKQASNRQILLFPLAGEQAESARASDLEAVSSDASGKLIRQPQLEIVVSGSFRKDLPGLAATLEQLKDLGLRILSPTSTTVVDEKDGFVYMQGEETALPETIELRHLEAIKHASFVWLHAPDGYVGPSAALEVGFARASGIPVFCDVSLQEPWMSALVSRVGSPAEAAVGYARHPPPPVPAVQSFQFYYARAAVQRGYGKETAQNTLLLMLEEFGELARALRKRERLRRDSHGAVAQEGQELADIFIYIVHMANVLGFDLAEAVSAKEQINIRRFLER